MEVLVKYYENIVIINADLSEDDTQQAINTITDAIKKDGGVILKSENWGQRKLAYELNKQRKGTFLYILFQGPPSIVPILERFYKIYDQVIKFMVIRLSKKEFDVALPQEKAAQESHISEEFVEKEIL
jgi:small subunit ribosomal protein S6